MIITILIFLIILGVLIFVHEFGHFWVAKKSGMKVEEFGFGFPPRIAGIQKVNGKWRWVWGHKMPDNTESTVYSINWIPLGGFVRILGENNEDEHDPRSFINQPAWKRFFSLVAGVVMNVLLAWVLVSAVYIPGFSVDPATVAPSFTRMQPPQVNIVGLINGGPAQKAGLKVGDTILQVNHIILSDDQSVQEFISSEKGQVIDFTIERRGQTLNINVKALSNPAPGQGATGIELETQSRLSAPWYLAPLAGAQEVYQQTGALFTGLYQLFTTKAGLANVGGPVEIAKLTGQVRQLGFAALIEFTAFLSLNLAILNALPFPALDGGRILFLVIEKVRRKRNNPNVEQFVNTVGFVLLLLLMVAVTIKDIIHK
jgi:regulator of sigma E protease